MVMTKNTINRLLVLTMLSIFMFLLQSCTTSPPTQTSGLSFDNTNYRQIASKSNFQGLFQLQQDTTALSIKPQSTNHVDVSPSIRPLFTGSGRVGMKLLIISAEDGDASLAGITYFAKEIGIPYEILIAKDTTLTQSKLVDANGDGQYQGIILTDKSLAYNNGGVFMSAFDETEWNLLWQYAREFSVRQVIMGGFPGINPEDYGLRNVDGLESGNDRIAKLTQDGTTIFSSLKANVEIPISGAYVYQASLCATACPEVTATTTPILTDSSTGNILGAVSKTADGREVLSLTMNHNSFLSHTGLLSYDLINWVTDGIFIGERRMYFTLDIDDHYLESAIWDPTTNAVFPTEGPGSFTYKITAKDLFAARDGVLDLRNRFNVPDYNYNQVFNADKADLNATSNCSDNATLSEATLCVSNFFPWLSHTLTHADMDFLSYSEARTEFESNITFAESRLSFDKQFAVTGRHSGLGWYRIADAPVGSQCVVDQVPGDPYCQFGLEASNVAMLQAAQDVGIKYLAANRGWNTHVAECDTCLITHPLNSNIKLVPRWPTNIFYNTTTPQENTSEFNYLYGPSGIVTDDAGNSFFDRALSWEEILDFEAKIGLRHILSTSPYPHYIHQANLREYSAGRSLAYDYSEAIFSEYSKFFSLPLVSQNWNELTDTLEKRTSFFKADASGIIDKINNTVTIKSTNGGTIFVTGVSLPNATTFNYGKIVSEVTLGAGETVSGTIESTTTPNPTTTILVNGDFNEGSLGWSYCNAGTTRFTNTGILELSNNGCVYQKNTATANSTYTLTCNAKREQAVTWSSINLGFYDSNNSQIASLNKEIVSSTFSPLTLSLTAPTTTKLVALTLYSEDRASINDCTLEISDVN